MARRDYYDDRERGMGIIGAALIGAIAGAAAVFFSDERNRRRVKRTMEDWKEKGTDAIEDVQKKVEKAKDEAVQRVDRELDRTQARLRRNSERPRARA